MKNENQVPQYFILNQPFQSILKHHHNVTNVSRTPYAARLVEIHSPGKYLNSVHDHVEEFPRGVKVTYKHCSRQKYVARGK